MEKEGNIGLRLLWQEDGLEIRYSEAYEKEPWELAFAGKVTLLFVQKGGVLLPVKKGVEMRLTAYQHLMIHPGKKEFRLRMDAGETSLWIVGLSPSKFLQMVDPSDSILSAFNRSIHQGKASSLSRQPLHMDLALQTCLDSILRCSMEPVAAKLFFRAKVLELIALHIHSWQRQSSTTTPFARTEYDRERLIFAREFLMQNMATPPSLPELARIAGINEFKLKRGFKEMFGHTVFGYLAEARLEMAREQLTAGGKRISEIAFDLGYSSLQHFSAAFKKRYGVPPNRLVS